MTDQDRVLIVGAGPVGMSCALFLSEHGIPFTILEAEDRLIDQIRASTFHPPTLDMLDSFGIADGLIAQGTKVPKWQYRKHESGESVVLDLSLIKGQTNHPYRLQCEQFRLTRLIQDYLKAQGEFDIRFGATVTQVEQAGHQVTLTMQNDGQENKISGRFVIAADGAQSSVRKAIGAGFSGKTYPKSSITAVVDYPFETLIPGLLNVNYVWTEGDSYSLMHLRDVWRCTYAPRDHTPADEATTKGRVKLKLQALFPNAEGLDVITVSHYAIHQRVMEDFVHGRVVFAGDAAHLNSPSGGMGMNSGIHDARCLVDHLVDVWRGADLSHLSTYGLKRKTIAVEEIQRLSDANYTRHRETDNEERQRIWQKYLELDQDTEKMYEFLLASSLIQSLRRESEVGSRKDTKTRAMQI